MSNRISLLVAFAVTSAAVAACDAAPAPEEELRVLLDGETVLLEDLSEPQQELVYEVMDAQARPDGLEFRATCSADCGNGVSVSIKADECGCSEGIGCSGSNEGEKKPKFVSCPAEPEE